ncbi:DNA/RNA helicase domain-containing protein [Sinorhizobium meliloti]|uniref:DNA/RNA helicase domain-containing protein n=1 Tax=Rhizobium meliloti TaxID=382 RepID=UPI00398CF630
MITVAIAFPHCLFKEQPPLDLPAKAILTMDDMDHIEQAVLRAFEAGGKQEEFTVDEFDAIIKVLAPEFRVYEPLKVGIDASSSLLERLTSQQLAVLRGFEGNPRAIIEGVAGSGKTLLAMQRALSFGRAKRSVLFTCFNVELAKWVREEIADRLVENGGNVTVSNFHRLASDLCKDAGIDFTVNQDQPQLWWDEFAPDLLAEAAMHLYKEEPAFDAIVVDEAQDFSPNWWDALEYLHTQNGPIWAFWDKAQSLRREPVDPPIKDAFRFNLTTNCRNTRRIAVCASTAANVPTQPFDLAPLGRPPRVIVPPNVNALSGLVQQELRSLLSEHRLAPKQIAVLSPVQRQNSPLSHVAAVDGVPFTSDAATWRANGGILWSTARSFKGLEADVIVLSGFAGLSDLFTVSDLYVALTRARSHLVVIPRDRNVRQTLDHAISVAATHGEETSVESLV